MLRPAVLLDFLLVSPVLRGIRKAAVPLAACCCCARFDLGRLTVGVSSGPPVVVNCGGGAGVGASICGGNGADLTASTFGGGGSGVGGGACCGATIGAGGATGLGCGILGMLGALHMIKCPFWLEYIRQQNADQTDT